ncbi:hypothetical protein [Erythrobacter sp.]|uniref:hypothetical protein n=1 Tax=Erythrobacter sp. TaxID=1042 RepID=UPI001425F460|nr:hypothetical protein [Erythrobacter sp.]QIQ87854.1 MAG: hypothetical protein G9473_15020 [Erythrobacter sp.]
MKRALIFSALPLFALAAACAPVDDGERSDDPTAYDPPVRVVGKAQNCIPLAQIRQTPVRSDDVIDFEMRGGKVYRNVLPNSCPQLGLWEAFTYDTEITRLCSAEIIYTLQQIGGGVQRGAGCGLGQFVPVEYVEEDEGE